MAGSQGDPRLGPVKASQRTTRRAASHEAGRADDRCQTAVANVSRRRTAFSIVSALSRPPPRQAFGRGRCDPHHPPSGEVCFGLPWMTRWSRYGTREASGFRVVPLYSFVPESVDLVDSRCGVRPILARPRCDRSWPIGPRWGHVRRAIFVGRRPAELITWLRRRRRRDHWWRRGRSTSWRQFQSC